MSSRAIPELELEGLRFAGLDRFEVLDHVFGSLRAGGGGWLVTANVDYLRLCAVDPACAALVRSADLVVADGIPLLWAARLARTPLPDRVAGSDLVWLCAERAASEGRSLYLLGGNPGAADAAARRFRERWPGLEIAGVSSPRVSADPDAAELREIGDAIERARPDLVYAAFGAPKELRVIAGLRPRLPAAWWIGVGISLSFAAGDVPRAPRWLQRMGLEWAYRLAQEPARLGPRYLLHDVPFALRMLARAGRARLRPAAPTCTR